MNALNISETFVQNLLFVLPDWHSKLVRPFKEMLQKEMSLETYYCLQTLKASGTATMTELAGQLRVPKQQVTKLVGKLWEHHFVERVYNADDRRVISIRLTPEAGAYLEEYHCKNTTFMKLLEDRLSEEELLELNHAVEILKKTLPKLK